MVTVGAFVLEELLGRAREDVSAFKERVLPLDDPGLADSKMHGELRCGHTVIECLGEIEKRGEAALDEKVAQGLHGRLGCV